MTSSDDEVNRYLDGEDSRHYEQGEDDFYSVTTILDKGGDQPYAIKVWKENNDGEGDNADWRHILNYKKNRGTLAHYFALANFEDSVYDAWTSDEQESIAELEDNAGDRDYLYSIAKDVGMVDTQYEFEALESLRLENILKHDLDYVDDKFDTICRERGIDRDSVEEVEKKFVLPPDERQKGYGGQVDLVYYDEEADETVVADLKTSKSVYDKHKLQVSAYAYAVAEHPEMNGPEVDRAEIIRINPDQKEHEVVEVDYESHFEDFANYTKVVDDGS